MNRNALIFTVRKRSLGQGNVFTPVCHSVHRGGCVSQHAMVRVCVFQHAKGGGCVSQHAMGQTPLGRHTPPGQKPPGQTPPKKDGH